ncbi:MAG: ABC transporter ATP-binding protein [Solirubrobacteraceae bacterium]|nr:ABC transporter ATP-binding protein [Solirubrobacteraceae bacterium]
MSEVAAVADGTTSGVCTEAVDTAADAGGAPIVRVRGVRKTFGGVDAVAGVDLDVRTGEFLSFLGPSGCGKTTLLRIIAGFERPDAGSVEVAGRDITALPPNRRPLNMVFQRYALFPHLTVRDNVAFGMRLRRLPRREIAARVAEMLELVQLTHCAGRHPNQISGGQAQRVALARALANDPTVLLLDEPLTALDRAVRGDMQQELKRIQAEIGTTFVYVTHDQEEAMAMSSRIALMSEGRIVQLAPPGELYRRPGSVFAAGFVGDANLLRCRVEQHAGRSAVVYAGRPLPGLDPAGRSGEVRAMVRPEDLKARVASGDDAGELVGELVSSTFHGFFWMHRIRIGHELLVVREAGDTSSIRAGDAVALEIEPGRAVLLAD